MSNSVKKFSPEVRSRAVRLVLEHEGEHPSWWTTMVSIAGKIGCSAHTLNEWVKKAEVETGKRAGVPAETINALFKAEVIHRRGPWRSFDAVEYATLEWVDWFNNRRILEPIGNITPAEAAQQFCTAMDHVPLAA